MEPVPPPPPSSATTIMGPRQIPAEPRPIDPVPTSEISETDTAVSDSAGKLIMLCGFFLQFSKPGCELI